MTLESHNPHSGELIKKYPITTNQGLEQIITLGTQNQVPWAEKPISERGLVLKAAARVLEEGIEEYAQIMTVEMGKPLTEARAEVKKCAWVCEYYAQNGEQFLADEFFEVPGKKAKVTFQPLGTILGIMPWNFPFWQVFRFVAPTLMAGNSIILKHASNVSGCALAIAEIWKKAGLSKGLFGVLLLPGKDLEPVMADPRIAAISLTGSTQAGRKVASIAGQNLKKVLLELGGSDPYVVLKDADLDLAAQQCVISRMINGGQSCIAAKRLIVESAVIKAFTAKVKELLKAYPTGDPSLESTKLGPMARHDLRQELHQQVQGSISLGAKLEMGGVLQNGQGAYYPATLLTEVKPGMPAYEQELFGPVVAIISAKDHETALQMANDTCFGLGAAIFTKDAQMGEKIASLVLQAGSCSVNMFVSSDPRLPFGGIKDSGYGRELSKQGIQEFVNAKTVCMAI